MPMNILDVFKKKIASLLQDNDQLVSQKLIELATFFYKVDGRVTLEEQQYIEHLVEEVEWDSSISPETFQRECLARVRNILEESDAAIESYLSNLMQALAHSSAVDKAVEIAQEIAAADDDIAAEEARYLEYIQSFS